MIRLLVPCVLAALLAAGGERQHPRPPTRDGLERAYRSNNLGVARLERFEHQQAVEAFREALRLAPSLTIARFNLALALYYDGQLKSSEQEARAAAALDSPHPEYLLGLLARAQGQPATAAAAFQRVLLKDPDDASAGTMLGLVRVQQGDARGAIWPLEKALEVEPHNATAAYNLSIALTRAARPEEARRMLERFQALRESGTATTIGNSYLEQGRYAEAIISTGGEPDLVNRSVPSVRFVGETLGAGGPVSRATDPVGRRFEPAELDAAGRRDIAAALGGAVTLFDYDNDGDLDLLQAAPSRERLWRNDGGRFTEVSLARFPRPSADAVTTGLVTGDYDNDGRADVLVLRYGGAALYRNEGGGRFTDVTRRAGLRGGGTELALTAAFVDLDHDGDLDVVIPGFVDLDARSADRAVVFPGDFSPAPTRVWRNNGNGTFADTTQSSGISAGRAVATLPTDFDLRRDIDLVIAGDDGRLALFSNQRDGSFRDVARESGLVSPPDISALAAGDLNRDGRTDLVIARRDGAATLALSGARGRYRMDPAPAGMTAVLATQLFDYDNDGLLDLMAWTPKGARLLRSVGDGWQEVTDATLASAVRGVSLPSLAAGRAVAVADLDGDGDQDLVVLDGATVRILRNEGGHRGGALRLRLVARVSNRSATGSKIEMRAGSLLVRRETFATTPPSAPLDVVFGLGGRSSAEAVRVLWPAGIVQAELQPPPGEALVITELDRKPSSCPYLFTWNGSRFEFVTDFLGGGELGYWAAPGVRNRPDSDEYVRIPPGALQPKDGRYELRITNELEEVLYLDHVRLAALAHPDDAEVYPNEGLVSPPFPAPKVYAVTRRRTPRAVVDDHGHDVMDAIRAVDRRYADDFALASIRGYAEPHAVTIRVDDDADVLLLSGWTDYAFSSDNVAASQRGLQLSPPALEVRDSRNGWRTALAEIGIPVGRPQTIVVDLRRPEVAGEREFRVVTNMRVYWDRIAVADVDDSIGVEALWLDLLAARLEWRGFSAESTPDGREPFGYDYASVTPISPWKTLTGRYTPVGDVRSLLASVDDRFVVARSGDQVSVSFDATAPPPLANGSTRTFLLYADGFSKEMDLNSASPDRVAPLPFHGMRAYPPADGVNPHDSVLSGPVAGRVVAAPVPSLDALLLLARPVADAAAPEIGSPRHR